MIRPDLLQMEAPPNRVNRRERAQIKRQNPESANYYRLQKNMMKEKQRVKVQRIPHEADAFEPEKKSKQKKKHF